MTGKNTFEMMATKDPSNVAASDDSKPKNKTPAQKIDGGNQSPSAGTESTDELIYQKLKVAQARSQLPLPNKRGLLREEQGKLVD